MWTCVVLHVDGALTFSDGSRTVLFMTIDDV